MGTGDPGFGEMLRAARLAAGMTQESLAEASGLSVRAIADLERGARKGPQNASADLLADGLGITGDVREAFLNLARSSRAKPGPRPAIPRALPPLPGAILARERELAAVAARFDAGARLVTLVGPGGIGKTRLALEIVHRAADAGEVIWTPVEAIADPADLLPAVAVAARISEQLGSPLPARIADALAGRPVLLAVDNLEHLLDGVAGLSELLDAAPELRLIATSREALRLRGETVLPVTPLPLPDAGSDLAANGAIALFLRQAGVPASCDVEDLAAAGRIVARLDGLPLAIELAGAHLDTLTPVAIEDLLIHAGVRALDGGRRDGPARFRTMEQAVRWSVDLLDDEARRMMRLLSVFRQGFTAAQAGEVAARSGLAVAAALPSLVRANIVRDAGTGPSGRRFAMLEPVRMVAADALAQAGEERTARDAHAETFADLAQRLIGDLLGRETATAMATYGAERANMTAALEYALATRNSTIGLRLLTGLGYWWEHAGAVREANAWMARVIPMDDGSASVRDRWLVRWLAGLVADAAGETADLTRYAAETMAIARDAGDAEGLAMAAITQALALRATGAPLTEVYARLDEAIRNGRECGTTLPTSFAHTLRGAYQLFYDTGREAAALTDLDQALAVHQSTGNESMRALVLCYRGAALRALGRPDEARASCIKAVAIAERNDQPLVRVHAAIWLASLAADENDPAAAGWGLRLIGALDRLIQTHGYASDDTFTALIASIRDRLAAAYGADAEEACDEGRRLIDEQDGGGSLIGLLERRE